MIERAGDATLQSGAVVGVAEEAPDIPPRKGKKTRRGKKRKLRYDDSDGETGNNTSGGGENADVVVLSPPATKKGSFDDDDVGGGGGEGGGDVLVAAVARDNTSATSVTTTITAKAAAPSRGPRTRLLRPTEVPKAPFNSTTFLIDDHEDFRSCNFEDCNLYLSFENNPDPPAIVPPSAEAEADAGQRQDDAMRCVSPSFAGFRDINYEYESPDDAVTSAFYEQDFEEIYRRAREDELQSTPREHILAQYVELERRLVELEKRIAPRCDPSPLIAKLQEELLQLQEENAQLRGENSCLQEGHQRGGGDEDLSSTEKEEDSTAGGGSSISVPVVPTAETRLYKGE